MKETENQSIVALALAALVYFHSYTVNGLGLTINGMDLIVIPAIAQKNMFFTHILHMYKTNGKKLRLLLKHLILDMMLKNLTVFVNVIDSH